MWVCFHPIFYMNKAILLAEDSLDDELFFRRVLLAAGVQNPVFATRDGRNTIAYLDGADPFSDRQAFPLPSILFLDLKMTPVDGWEVLAWLKAKPMFSKMPVIVLTQIEGMKELTKAYSLGAKSFLVKPFKHATLPPSSNISPIIGFLRPKKTRLRLTRASN